MGIVTVNPNTEQRDLIPPDKYGVDSAAVLLNFTYGPGKFTDRMVATFKVSVNAAGNRRTSTFDEVDWDSGSKVPRFLRQLGITNEQQLAGFDPASLADTQVIVDIGIEEFTRKDGTRGQKNVLKDIRKLGD